MAERLTPEQVNALRIRCSLETQRLIATIDALARERDACEENAREILDASNDEHSQWNIERETFRRERDALTAELAETRQALTSFAKIEVPPNAEEGTWVALLEEEHRAGIAAREARQKYKQATTVTPKTDAEKLAEFMTAAEMHRTGELYRAAVAAVEAGEKADRMPIGGAEYNSRLAAKDRREAAAREAKGLDKT